MPVHIDKKEMIPILLFTGLMMVGFVLPELDALSWILQFGLYLLAGFGLAALLGLLPARNFIKLIRSRARA